MPPWLALILVLISAAGFLVLATAWLMARSLLSPPRMKDAKANWVLKRLSPEDLGLKYERLSVDVRDDATGGKISLAAWWIAHPDARGRCVILIHGYADAKVGAIAWSPLFHELGWNILAIDLRAHGESGGDYTTAGYYERHDLNQVINRLRLERPNETKQIVLFGASMGAAVVAATAAQRDDLSAVILESPFADFRHAVMAHFELLGAPGRPVQNLALRLAQWLAKAEFHEIRPVDLIPRLPCPLLLIASEQDPFVSPSDKIDLKSALDARAALPFPTRYWHADGASHLLALIQNPDEYRRRIADFLAECARCP